MCYIRRYNLLNTCENNIRSYVNIFDEIIIFENNVLDQNNFFDLRSSKDVDVEYCK